MGIFTKIFLCGFAVYAAITLISLQLQINDHKSEIKSLSNDLAKQKIANTELQEVLDNGLNDEYVAREARDKLGYASPGERIFVDTSSK
ncbi:MAG: septum formation initiator family protein [Clostridiales bacterium]|nr:septum formation initiator family protein [Clostridiales bacterium]